MIPNHVGSCLRPMIHGTSILQLILLGIPPVILEKLKKPVDICADLVETAPPKLR